MWNITYHDRRKDDTPGLDFPISAQPDPGIKCERLLRIPESIKNCLKKGRSNQNYILKGEDLWKTVIKSWNETPEEVLARTYLMYHQIINAIIKQKGKDDFLYEKGGLHFGCRRQFIFDEDGRGVYCIPVDNDLYNLDSI